MPLKSPLPKNTVPGAASGTNVGRKKILLICKLRSFPQGFPSNACSASSRADEISVGGGYSGMFHQTVLILNRESFWAILLNSQERLKVFAADYLLLIE